MKKLVIAFLLLLPASVWAQVHQEILFDGLTGNELLDSLAVHYKPSSVLNYDNARDLMFSEIYNENGINICVYTGDTIEIPFGDPNPRTIANAHDPNWNTEHVYPQSKGASSGNARSDLHHLMPVRADVNSSRGNTPYGFVADGDVTTWWSSNGSQSVQPDGDTSNWSKAMGSSRFEPMDDTKGSLARAVFYFYTMYRAQAEAADPTFFSTQYEALREFHNMHEVDELEVTRTYQIADVQSDKPNPFVIDTTLVRRAFYEDFEFETQVVEGEYFVDFEAFSSGSKGSYGEGTVDLNGIIWTMSNALIGSLEGDMTLEERSARLRHETDSHAFIQMEGDKSMGLGTVSFYYSRSDFTGDRSATAPAFIVEYSIDQGSSWTQTGPPVDLAGVNEFTLFESAINENGIGRIRIRSTGGSNGRRFNIDDIQITNYIETEAELTITGREGWRMLSPPVKSVKLSDLLANIFTQGFPGSDFENAESNVYLFDEAADQFVAPASMEQIVESGTGIIVWVFENDDKDDIQITGSVSRQIQLTGEEPGDILHPMSFTENGDSSKEGWNLLGNPYNTALSVAELELLLEEDINNNIHVWDANAGSEGEYIVLSSEDIDATIAPFQGFWVKTDAINQNFPFSKDAATDNGTFLKNNDSDVKISIGFDGNFRFGQSRLVFTEHGSVEFTNRDAFSLIPLNAAHAFSYFDKQGRALSTAYLPIRFEDGMQIPFSVESTVNLDGYLEADISGDIEGWEFILEHTSTGETWNLLSERVPYAAMAKTAEISPLNPQSPVRMKSPVESEFLLRVTNNTSTGIVKPEIPVAVNLEQNYPNPFNPSTTIRYSVPEQQHVSIEVFDMLGRRVSVLVNETVQPGHHELIFDASALSSGVYLYRLSTPTQMLTRRMTLIK